MMADTDPFPLVPAMWTTGIERGGKKERSEVIRSRPGLMDMARAKGVEIGIGMDWWVAGERGGEEC